jgi:hypothetical protein
MTAIATTLEKLDMGQVIQTTFALLRRNLGHLALPTGLLVLAPQIVASALLLTKTAPAFSPAYWTVSVVSMGFWAIFQATGIQVLVSDMSGAAVDVRANLRQSLSQFPALVAIVALNLLAMLLGAILLIVPGLMVATAFAVVLQARVVEHTGIFEAFDRSRRLTRGNRWRIFGLISLFIIVYGVIQETFSALFGGVAPTGEMSPAMLIVMQILGLASGLIGLAGGCVLYAELRRIKDGAGAHDLSAVFD